MGFCCGVLLGALVPLASDVCWVYSMIIVFELADYVLLRLPPGAQPGVTTAVDISCLRRIDFSEPAPYF